MLALILLALFWYAAVPIAGAFVVRRSWRLFRARFDSLRRAPLLDYTAYRSAETLPRDFRFLGSFESVVDDRQLWVRNESLTVPVRLEGARVYLLPSAGSGEEGNFESEGEVPERIRWDRLSTLSDGVRVFIGGRLHAEGGKRTFCSFKNAPLLVILYDGTDRSLMYRTVRAGRHRNEYWNPVSPYSLAVGVFSQLIIAVGYLPRPAYRLAAMVAFAAMFGPLIPFMPPGVLCTALYRRLWRRARTLREYRDLVRLPTCHLDSRRGTGQLPDGSPYSFRIYEEPPALEDPPQVIPPGWRGLPSIGGLRVYGTVGGAAIGEGLHPERPKDPMGAYVMIPGDPETLAPTYSRRAYFNEVAAVAVFLLGLVVNVAFVVLVLFLLR